MSTDTVPEPAPKRRKITDEMLKVVFVTSNAKKVLSKEIFFFFLFKVFFLKKSNPVCS